MISEVMDAANIPDRYRHLVTKDRAIRLACIAEYLAHKHGCTPEQKMHLQIAAFTRLYYRRKMALDKHTEDGIG